MTIDLKSLNLADAKPIDFDDIREGDMVARVHLNVLSVIEVKKRPDRASVLGPGGGFLFDTNDAPSSWFLLSRPEPTVKPGTTGTATVRGVPGVRVMRTDPFLVTQNTWVSGPVGGDEERYGFTQHTDDEVADFVADPKPGTIPQELRESLDALTAVAVSDTSTIARAADDVIRLYLKATRDV